MRKYRNLLIIFAGASLMLQAIHPLSASGIQISSAKQDSKKGGFELKLNKLGIKPKDTKLNAISEIQKRIGITNPFLLTQTPDPAQTPLVPNPEMTIDGNPLDPNENFTPAFLPRAVAPPVGDISVSNMNTEADTINLGTSAVVQNLVLKDAPVREVLGFLARAAGLNLVFTGAKQGGDQAQAVAEPTISLDLEQGALQDVFNSVLLVSGLNANRRGNTIYVGPQLPDAARNLISRTLRVNQVTAQEAAAFLASQGATFDRIVSEEEDIRNQQTGAIIGTRRTTPEFKALKITREADSLAPLLLNGLKVSTDERLNVVSLVGEPRKVEIATAFITQLDARRRQVAINVKVIDVNLLNEDTYNSSFSFGVNDSFFVQDRGAASLRFGSSSPVSRDDLNGQFGRISNPPAAISPFFDGVEPDANTFLDFNNTTSIPGTVPNTITINQQNGTISVQPGGSGQFFNRTAGVSGNPFQAGFTDFTLAQDTVITIAPNGTPSIALGTPGTATAGLPVFFQFPKRFLALLEAQITNRNAKILTDPTLVVQEGQQASVKLVQNIVENLLTEVDRESGVRTTTAKLAEVGLILNINIDRIDDNGFVNLTVNPIVSAPGESFQLQTTELGDPNFINLITKRELSSGLIRLRDSQTLILSGIIQESDRTTVSKIPVLGDLPLIGSLFRNTSREKERAEVIILLTPQIIEDSDRNGFGYNYSPGQDARNILRDRGFPVQGNPSY